VPYLLGRVRASTSALDVRSITDKLEGLLYDVQKRCPGTSSEEAPEQVERLTGAIESLKMAEGYLVEFSLGVAPATLTEPTAPV
jgi:hypothetical protein